MYRGLADAEFPRRGPDRRPVLYDVQRQRLGALFHIAFHTCTTPMLKPAWEIICCEIRQYAPRHRPIPPKKGGAGAPKGPRTANQLPAGRARRQWLPRVSPAGPEAPPWTSPGSRPRRRL